MTSPPSYDPTDSILRAGGNMGWDVTKLSDRVRRLIQAADALDAARLSAPVPPPAVASKKAEGRREVKELHAPFRQWLELHRLVYLCARSDKPSSIQRGWPDFTIFRAGRVACVEFKWPGQKLRAEQEEARTEIEGAGIPFLTAYSAADAIAFVKQELNITIREA